MSATDMVRWSLRWGNPSTLAAHPRVKMAMLVPRGTPCPPELLAHWEPGGPYAVSFELVTQQPVRRWSKEAKARARRRNLKRRLEKRVPLFASIFEAEELARRPDYYSAEDAR